MPGRHILAMGGGQGFGDPVIRHLFEIADRPRPRVCYLATASGDAAAQVTAFYRAFPARRFEPTDLALFDRTVGDLRSFVLGQHVVLVGGGNTVSLLAIWRAHGLDEVLREAWASGVILAGGSAGALCWFEAGTTDSFCLGRADPLSDGLGLLPGSFCPHFDREPERRPHYLGYVADGTLPPGIGCDDFAAVHFEGRDVSAVLASRRASGARRVDRTGDGEAVEEVLEVSVL